MQIVRFLYKRKISWGVVEGGVVHPLEGHPFERFRRESISLSLSRIKLLVPAVSSKIILAGLNYKDHAAELGMKLPAEPIIFLKPPTALIGHNQNIVYPYGVRRLDYEGELAVIMKKEGKNIPERKTADYILGYTCLNDVTARDLQKKDGQWTRSKSFDTFCPVGPWIETDLNPDNLRIRTFVNGTPRQDSTTANFIFPVRYLVSFISRIMTLYPGDIISTGTPPGVGALKAGDCVEIDIEGIGRLRNNVVRQR